MMMMEEPSPQDYLVSKIRNTMSVLSGYLFELSRVMDGLHLALVS